MPKSFEEKELSKEALKPDNLKEMIGFIRKNSKNPVVKENAERLAQVATHYLSQAIAKLVAQDIKIEIYFGTLEEFEKQHDKT